MKLAMILSLALGAVTAEARSPITFLTGHLERFQLAPAHEERFGRVESGKVEVDLINKKIRVSLYPRANSRCMPKPEVVELPLFNVTMDRCNIAHYSARTAETIPGGAIETLDVADNTKNRCPTFVALSPTEVTYVTSQAVYPPRKDVSKFEGQALFAGRQSDPRVPRCR